jgi:hypothetical protein
MSIDIKSYRNIDSTKATISATFEETIAASVPFAIYEEIVRLIAQRYVEENYAEIVSKLDQQAIANLAIADSGKKIAEEIRVRPTVLREKTTKYSIF